MYSRIPSWRELLIFSLFVKKDAATDTLGYFSGIFRTYEEAKASIDHVGRLGVENCWYEIEAVEVGTVYTFSDYNKLHKED